MRIKWKPTLEKVKETVESYAIVGLILLAGLSASGCTQTKSVRTELTLAVHLAAKAIVGQSIKSGIVGS
jgi:hypothetical protein